MNWFRELLTLIRRRPPAPDDNTPPPSPHDTGRIEAPRQNYPEGRTRPIANTWDSPQSSGRGAEQTRMVAPGQKLSAGPNDTGRISAPNAYGGFEAPEDDNPQTIGPYKVAKLIGEGGMGRVYQVSFGEANEEGDVQQYALKTITPLDATDIEYYERFKREITIGLKLAHPNVCRMVDWGIEENGVPYLVMELMEGDVLSRVIAAKAPIEMEHARPIIMQILAGLDAIHAHGVVHRDLKPANVFLTNAGQVKLMDFGIARQEGSRSLTVTGAALGTPEFVAPEQVLDTKRVDPRADLFNVGLILYQMLTGHLPFESNSVDGTLLRLVKGEQTPITDFRADLPDGVADWIQKILSKKPVDRYQSAVEAARAITF